MTLFVLMQVPYIWKELGTNCRNLPQVHSIVRIMRMIGEIVCPSVILLGEVVMEPAKVVPYFGTTGKTRMSYALQCYNNGDYMAYGSN